MQGQISAALAPRSAYATTAKRNCNNKPRCDDAYHLPDATISDTFLALDQDFVKVIEAEQ